MVNAMSRVLVSPLAPNAAPGDSRMRRTEAVPEVVLELLRIKPRIFLSNVHDRSQHTSPFDWILKREMYPLRGVHTQQEVCVLGTAWEGRLRPEVDAGS